MSIERWKSRQIRFHARAHGLSYTQAKKELERQEAEKESDGNQKGEESSCSG